MSVAELIHPFRRPKVAENNDDGDEGDEAGFDCAHGSLRGLSRRLFCLAGISCLHEDSRLLSCK